MMPLHPGRGKITEDAKLLPASAVSELVVVKGAVHQKRAAQSLVHKGLTAAVSLVGAEIFGPPGIDSLEQSVQTWENCLLELGPFSWPFCLHDLRGDQLPALYQVMLPLEV